MPPKKNITIKNKNGVTDVFIKQEKPLVNKIPKSNKRLNSVSDQNQDMESSSTKSDKRDIAETSTKTIEERYQKKTPIEHILLRPDTYVGDISIQKEMMWIYDSESNKIVKKDIEYVPGLYKIFDEILVNARDRNTEDPTCDTIKVNIDQETNTISVWNNGKGIDVVEHAEHKMYIPEMLFGELLTSTNYDDTQKRTTGGRNGYGAKLTNVFSTFFSVETIDGDRKLKFYQEFTNNLSNRTSPTITQLKSEKPMTYTKITFCPDLIKFKLTSLTDDIVSLMSKRVIDIAGVTNKMKVYLNDKKIDVNNFKKYISLYQINPETENTDSDPDSDDDGDDNTEKENKENIIYEESNRWRLGVIYNPDGNFEQVSFVNGICTYHGGNHVDHVVSQIIKKLEVIILKKYKEAKIKQATIKENLVIFLDSVIENPAFTSQTKETLKTKVSDFGSSFEASDKLIKRLASTGIVDQIIQMAQLKEESFMKKTDGKKTTSVRGIPKLEDAEFAGSKKSAQCKLILTEGDSAKALAMAGRSVVGSQYYGVFPLKGKLLNVRDASPKQLLENEEIINIKKIIGLQHNKEYTDINDLRYGGIILMCDQDYDGFHIKGLLMNFFHFFWPSLLKNHSFIHALSTPIVKAIKRIGKKQEIKVFYNLTDYAKWKELPESKLYTIKYYKGLGTSTKEEAKEYFQDIEHKLISYVWKEGDYVEPQAEHKEDELFEKIISKYSSSETDNNSDNSDNEIDVEDKEIGITAKSKGKGKEKKKTDSSVSDNFSESIRDVLYRKTGPQGSKKIFGVGNKYVDDCTEAITLGFEKNRANCRKIWLKNYNKERILSNDQKKVPIPDFIHKELIHFSNDDINRSIPSVVDGLKPSTRKILYGTILRKLNSAKDEIKVAQLSGFISEKTSYHHGEASLNGAIVGMAQNFVGSNNINLLYPSGQFGCLDPNTEILLWNGSKKLAKDIQVGDQLIGDDGNRRNVLQLTNGIDDMYEIVDESRNKLVVNSEHILTLYYKDNFEIKWNDQLNHWYYNYYDGYTIKTISLETNESKNEGYTNILDSRNVLMQTYNHKKIIDIKIRDYLSLPEIIKNELYQISNLNSINWDKKTVPIDPYVFGTWLGENHNIPNMYIVNDKNTRLQLLAGVIDKKGALINKNGEQYFEISLLNRLYGNLMSSLDFIAKSLGFYTNIYYTNKNNLSHNDDDNTIVTITIQGDNIYEIPTYLEGNQINNNYDVKLKHNFTRFQIKHIGKGPFCGWSIDCNERFLLGNFTVTHNSRLCGGKDFASPRYTFTYLAELTRLIFRPDDDPILNYLDDDGTPVEPEYFCPIIPMILVNGSEGIGTGFSTKITQYNPLDIVKNLKLMMNNKAPLQMTPYFKNFTGTVEYQNNNMYLIKGAYKRINDETIKITELPIGTWTTPYNEFIEKKSEKGSSKDKNPLILSYKKNYTDETIDFTLKFDPDVLDKLESTGQIWSKLKLCKPLKMSNMHLYNANGKIKKYDNAIDILTEFYAIRLEMYTKRKSYLIGKLQKELDILKWKKQFIEYVLDGRIIIYRQKKTAIIDKLIELEFPMIDDTYDYITNIPLFNLTEEKVNELIEQFNNKQEELHKVESTTEIEQWNYELDEFIESYNKWIKTHSNLDIKLNPTKLKIKK